MKWKMCPICTVHVFNQYHTIWDDVSGHKPGRVKIMGCVILFSTLAIRTYRQVLACDLL